MSYLRLFALLFIFLLNACSGSQFLAGRQAYLKGDNESALAYFQSAVQENPNYTHGTAFQQGIWSYVGRTEYAAGKCRQARETLQRALAPSQRTQEDVARLYYGLSLACDGDRQQALKEIEEGMRGIHTWLEYVTEAHRFSFGQFWDPQREIRTAIQGDLAMISGRDVDWNKLISSGEWLGKRMEEEIDRARQDESREMSRDSDGGGGDEP